VTSACAETRDGTDVSINAGAHATSTNATIVVVDGLR
jgi:hypothetical protein